MPNKCLINFAYSQRQEQSRHTFINAILTAEEKAKHNVHVDKKSNISTRKCLSVLVCVVSKRRWCVADEKGLVWEGSMAGW